MFLALNALRSYAGRFVFYQCTLNAKQINELITPLNKVRELNASIEFDDESIGKIKNYLSSYDLRMINSIIIGSFEGYPEWIEFKLGDFLKQNNITTNPSVRSGLLTYKSKPVLFPIMCHSYIQAISELYKENSNTLADENYPVIIIGHDNTNTGIEVTNTLLKNFNDSVVN